MSAKTVLVLCAQALLAHVALSQCVYPGAGYLQAAPSVGASSCGALGGNGLGYGAGLGIGSGHGIGSGLGYGAGIGNGCAGTGLSAASIEVTPTSGGGLPVSSVSSVAPTGLSVASENAYEGALTVAGELPFLGTVGLQGVLPTAGAGIVSYGCGNGITAITSNAVNSAGAVGLGAGIGSGAIGYGSGIGAISPAVGGLGIARGHGCGCGGY